MNDWTRLTQEDNRLTVHYRFNAGDRCHHYLQERYLEYETPTKHIELTDEELVALCRVSGVYRQMPEVQALVTGMRRAEQAIRNLGNGFLTGDAKQIALNEAANIRADLAPFETTDA